MKRIGIFFTLFMGCLFFINAQDLIILKDGNTIEAKVLEISPTEIKYKRFDHLDGPTIVVLAVEVLSIRYENGRTDIINASAQPSKTITNNSAQKTSAAADNSRLNTIGATFGYQGVSAFGFSLFGTVSPVKYTFFDFNLGIGFNNFAFNGRVNFNAFVPFTNGGWYAGIGVGGGYNELSGGVIAGNITTGFLFFNWLNIGYTLQLGNFDGIVNHNAAVGYVYRFNSPQDNENDTSTRTPKGPREMVSHHWISIESPDLLFLGRDQNFYMNIGIGARYQYQFSPKFAIGGNINFNRLTYDNVIDFDLRANGYWYPSGRIFFLQFGLGYYHYESEYSTWESTLNALSIVPGFGWTIDIGKPGGFFLSTGLEMPYIIGKYRSEYTWSGNKYTYEGLDFGLLHFRVFFGIGYSF